MLRAYKTKVRVFVPKQHIHCINMIDALTMAPTELTVIQLTVQLYTICPFE